MKWKLDRHDGILFVLAVAGLTVFLVLYPRVFPESLMSGGLGKAEILERGKTFVEKLGYPLKGYDVTMDFRHSPARLHYLQKRFGLSKIHTLASDSLPVFLWHFRWVKVPDSANVAFRFGGNDEQDAEEALQGLLGDIRVVMDLDGNVDECTIRQRSSVKALPPNNGPGKPPFEPGEGKPFRESGAEEILDRNVFETAKTMMTAIGGQWVEASVRPDSVSGQPPFSRILRWKRKETVVGLPVSLDIGLAGGDIRQIRRVYDFPKPYNEVDHDDQTAVVVKIL